MNKRQIDKKNYDDTLRERYQQMPEIARIEKHRRVPKAISKAGARKKEMLESRKVKEENRRKHSKPGAVPFKSERKKHILASMQ